MLRRRSFERENRQKNGDKRRAWERQYRLANKEKALERVRKWQRSDKGREWRRRYYQADPHRYQRWYQSNLEAARMGSRIKQNRRRAAQAGAKGACSPEQIQQRIAYYGFRCYLCSEPWQAIDHVIALSRGGSQWAANLRPICRKCNSSKGARPLSVMEG